MCPTKKDTEIKMSMLRHQKHNISKKGRTKHTCIEASKEEKTWCIISRYFYDKMISCGSREPSSTHYMLKHLSGQILNLNEETSEQK